jgi:uncharacterized membrane protein
VEDSRPAGTPGQSDPARLPATSTEESVELRVSRQQLEEWSSPFVPATELERLGGVVENGAERAFGYAEREQEHRHLMDGRQADRLERADKREYVLSWAGMCLAFGLAVAAIVSGVVLGLRDQGVAGTILGGTGLVLIIVAFLRRPPPKRH